MYEQFGIPGMIAYRRTVEYSRSKGLIVIGDVKRGDIGSTSEAYARGHLAGKAFDVDFATVWGQGHTMAERTGSSTENFIAWVNDCCK